jgi:processing peptidase subunit alpha
MRFPAEENIDKITRGTIFDYMRLYHTPERMVLAGVGVDHQQLCDYAEKYFNVKNPVFGVRGKDEEPDNSLSQYVGGYTCAEKDLSHVSIGTSPMPELAHFVLGLNSSPHQDLDDFIPTCVLNMLMGGGGSFSAGGPGKGMYTRLYTNVLNRYHWMFSATAYNHSYMDTGVFCIHASAHPSQLRDMVTIIVKEMFDMRSKVPEVELKRAKAQLQSMLLMNLEARPVVFEDVSRQVLSAGFRRSPRFYIDKISRVTEEDIHRIVTRMLRSKPAVVARGDIKQMPSLDDITTGLSCEGRVPKRYTLFR